MHCFGELYHTQEPGGVEEIQIRFISQITLFFPLLIKIIAGFLL